MTEEVQFIIEATTERMDKAIEHLEAELGRLRAGKANPKMLESVMVDYYGSQAPINQVANIGTPDPRTIAIQPWEKNMIDPIEKAILNSNLGFNPQNNGETIRIIIPALTEERRVTLVKQVNSEGENAKVSIRSARKEANAEIKQLEKDGLSEDDAKSAEGEVQKLTDKYAEKSDKIVKTKEDDIMKI